MLSPSRKCTLPALLAAGALAVAGCGGDDGASSPLDEALGHLPQDAGFAFVASTELEDYDELRETLQRFPFAGRAEEALKQGVEQGELDFEEQTEPLLGNEVVVGTDDNASFLDSSQDTPFILALETNDADALEEVATTGGERTGDSEGYDIYRSRDDDDNWMAVKDEVLVLSDNEDTLRNALQQRGEDDRLTEDDVEPAFDELPEDAPIRAYANVAALLAADPSSEEALKVKWLDQLETLGLSAAATDGGIGIDYFLRTNSDELGDEDLPLASGEEAPQLLEREGGTAEVVLGLRDPSQIVDFGLATARVIDPGGFAEFEAGKQAVGRRLGIDVDDDVLAQLTGDVAAVATIDGEFGIRAELEDADAFEDTLAKIMDGLPEFSDAITVTDPRRGDRFYGVASGGQTYAVGVAEGSLVVANTAALASEVATRPLVDAEDAEGAFVAAADAEQLANALLARLAGTLEGLGGALFTGPLGDLRVSAESSTDGISGRLELEIE